MKLSEKAKNLRNAYHREWRSEHKQEVRNAQTRYWEKKARELEDDNNQEA